tara:strand:- start:4527 stop:5075 length:549 start_codon:yes stop_codon:yes gene_type:complete
MSSILYYSNYCNNCKNLLSEISKSNIKKDIHFISIDKRINKNNSTYIILENNQELLLPHTVNAVPALLLINDNYKVLFGDSIKTYLKPINEIQNNISTNFNGEPSAFSLGDGLTGVVSDNFSFLDQSSEDLSAKGNGGLRQMYNYATINHNDKIETPPDDYVPDKVDETSLKNYESNRNNIN